MSKIVVVGTGYVGMAMIALLARKHLVTALDIDPDRIELLRRRRSPIEDQDIARVLADESVDFRVTIDEAEAYSDADFVIICTPTDYDPQRNYFNTDSVERAARAVTRCRSQAVVIIKSTIPIGFSSALRNKLQNPNIVFCPEFLREGRALHDNLYPSRIVVGDRSVLGQRVAALFSQSAIDPECSVLLTGCNEAEAIKLFSNTYLALRVAYFNEIDMYAENSGLSSREVIEGMCLDRRIGAHYNNPSFGFGGYCLPKDTRQAVADFVGLPQRLFSAIVASNESRIEWIARRIISTNAQTIGVYRLAMKAGSDNFRMSSIRSVMQKLEDSGVKVVVFEPGVQGDKFEKFDVINDLAKFVEISDVIIANRRDARVRAFHDKIYSRDIFERD